MDISFSSMFFHDAPLADIFHAPSYCGAENLEFWFETPNFWLNGMNLDEVKGYMHKYPTSSPLSVHAPVLDLNPCSINPDIREASVKWIKKSIEMGDSLGASVCTIHPGKRTAKRPPGPVDYARLDQMLHAIEHQAESVQVKVAIENMEPAINALLTTPEEINQILEEYSWLWFTFDTAHAMKAGPAVAEAFLDMGGKKLVNIHLSGMNATIMHGLVSQDPITTHFLPLIQKSGYNGQITLELNDLVLPGPLTYYEKIQIMKDEIMVIRSSL